MSFTTPAIRSRLFMVCFVLLVLTAAAVLGDRISEAEGVTTVLGNSDVFLPAIYNPLTHPQDLQLVPFVTGLQTDTITGIVNAGDDRLFIVEREGYVRIAQPDGTVLPTPFLDISSSVVLSNWEEGLLGLVFHPQYPTLPYFFVSYTSNWEHKIRIVRYAVNPQNPNQADYASRAYLITINKPADGNEPDGISPVHNGGDMHFGPDGYLYISTGDGGPDPYLGSGIPGDPNNNSQDMHTLLGKILRIDVNPGSGLPADCGGSTNYSIPPDNPFIGGGACDEIWATGIRNAWRFSFDSLTGDMYIGDVGEWLREEINLEPAGSPGGLNYGWHCWEGTVNYAALPGWDPTQWPFTECGPIDWYTFPIHEYDGQTDVCAITGGYVYRGSQFPALYGHYVYADFCNRLWVLYQGSDGTWVNLAMSNPDKFISTFGVGTDGELYAGSWRPAGPPNTVYKVVLP
jgi:glucose/arabinose dehydrogenase